jgi:hypothetical protein
MMEALEMGEVASPARARQRQVLGGAPRRNPAPTVAACRSKSKAAMLRRIDAIAEQCDGAQVENGDPCGAFIC